MNISDHISELGNRAKTIEMWYDYASDKDRKFGMRSEDRDINIDGISWMLYGTTVLDMSRSESLKTVDDIVKAKPGHIRVTVDAQAIVSGRIISVHLGQYACTKNYVSENTGRHTLSLVRV